MNANAKAWVDELYHGGHKQGRGCLTGTTRHGEKHCCLGVACVLAVEAGVTDRRGSRYGPALADDAELEGSVLPDEVMNWLGMRTKDGSLLNGDSLAVLNDGGATFEEIAEIIEFNQEELFTTEPTDRR